MEITYDQNHLIIGDMKKTFKHDIQKVIVLKDKAVVLLSIPQNDDTIDNIFALSHEVETIWQAESLKKLYPDEINLPYEYMDEEGDIIKATDFYGRRYFINVENGHIIKRDFVK